MDLRSRLDYLRNEHEEILRFLDDWEGTLKLAGHDLDEERLKSLSLLREAEQKLIAIQEHCHREERTAESPFPVYLDHTTMAQLAQEHERLRLLTNDFLRELTFATLLRTDDLVRLGSELLEQLRKHIAYETGLLKQIETGNAAEEKLPARPG